MRELGTAKKAIAENLRRICKEKGVRQKDVADYIGVSTGCVANWFSGTNGIDIENLYAICQHFGFTLNQVFGIDDHGGDITTGEFSAPELHLVNVYRALNALGKERLTAAANDLVEIDRYTKDTVSAQTASSS